jgi:hypothetical protein
MPQNATTAGDNRGRAGNLDTACGSNSGSTQNFQADSRPRLRLISFKPLVKNSLRGFAEVEFPNGLRLLDCPVLVSNGKAWCSLPSKPLIDREGRQKRDANGKPAFSPVLEWRDRDLANRFSEAVVGLVREAHPGALEGDSR